jgi:hypothetical protein
MNKAALEKGRFFYGTVLLGEPLGRVERKKKYENNTLDFLRARARPAKLGRILATIFLSEQRPRFCHV